MTTGTCGSCKQEVPLRKGGHTNEHRKPDGNYCPASRMLAVEYRKIK